MLVTGRLLRSLGIRVTLFVMPAVFLGGSLGVLLAPVLLSAAVLRASQGLLRYSVDKSTTELLYLPVTPPAVKGQIKSFIDGFVWRTADGIGGLACCYLRNPLNFSPGRMSLLNFVLSERLDRGRLWRAAGVSDGAAVGDRAPHAGSGEDRRPECWMRPRRKCWHIRWSAAASNRRCTG